MNQPPHEPRIIWVGTTSTSSAKHLSQAASSDAVERVPTLLVQEFNARTSSANSSHEPAWVGRASSRAADAVLRGGAVSARQESRPTSKHLVHGPNAFQKEKQPSHEPLSRSRRALKTPLALGKWKIHGSRRLEAFWKTCTLEGNEADSSVINEIRLLTSAATVRGPEREMFAGGASRRRCGFTLIELMIVIGIMMIIMSIGIPSFVRTIRKESLRKAVSDMVEGCSYARAQAILKSTPMDLVIRADRISVEQAQQEQRETSDGQRPASSGSAQFSAQLPDDVAVKLLYVNFQDKMESPDSMEARVRFFPNGTSDEFTVILFSANGERKISVDVVTGLADVDVIR